VTPLATTSVRRAPAVNVGTFSYPTGMVITGSTGLVLDTYGGQVSLFSIRIRHAYTPITVGTSPSPWPSRADRVAEATEATCTPYAVWVRPVTTTGA
jgi:hypothetical protein